MSRLTDDEKRLALTLRREDNAADRTDGYRARRGDHYNVCADCDRILISCVCPPSDLGPWDEREILSLLDFTTAPQPPRMPRVPKRSEQTDD